MADPIGRLKSICQERQFEGVAGLLHTEAFAEAKLFLHVGNSMNPTLKSSDILYVLPYKDKRVRRGDVVVFYPPGEKQAVAHRVVGHRGGLMRTAGDNNRFFDPYFVEFGQIVGRAACVLGGSGLHCIHGGPTGRIVGALARSRSYAIGCLRSIFRPVHGWLLRYNIPKHLRFPRLRTQIVSLERNTGNELQLFLGKFMIGRLPAHEDRWVLRAPFKLLIDEESLPGRNGHVNGSV